MVAASSQRMHLGAGFGFNALHTAATESGNGVPGRPGINPLRYDIIYTVPERLFEEVQKLNEKWGSPFFGATGRLLFPYHPKIDKEETSFLGSRIVAGDEPSIEYIPLKQDVEGNLRQIKNAKKNSSIVVASCHSHNTDPALKNKWGAAPAEYIRNYAKDCIDAGADVFYGHGAHAGQGLEIYKGKPIFYSLASWIATAQNIKRLCLEEYERFGVSPDATISEWMDTRSPTDSYQNDNWLKTVVATFTLQDGKLTELKLHPVDSTLGEPAGTYVYRGTHPLMAEGEEARRIIERYAGLSARFGTEIEFKDGIGIVKV